MRIRNGLSALVMTAAAGVVAVFGTVTPAHAATSTATSPLGSPNSATIIAFCPAGNNVVGASGQVNGGGGNVVLTAVIPDVAGRLVVAIAEENGPFAGMWSVTAIAICEPVAAVVPIIVNTASNSVATKAVAPACPAAARLTGLGFAVTGGNGRVFPQQAQPAAALTGAMFSATENGAFAGNWQLTGYLLCANPAGFAPSVQFAATALNSVSPKAVGTVGCPAGSTVFGVGGMISPLGVGAVVLDSIVPDAAQTIATANGTEFGAFAGNWRTSSYAICW